MHIKTCSSLAEVGEHGVDELESLVDFLADLGTCQDDLAGHEDQEYNLGLHHTVDETREELRLVRAEHVGRLARPSRRIGNLMSQEPTMF